MRIGNVGGRALLIAGESAGIDIAEASEGAFGPAMAGIYRRWDDFRAWAAQLDAGTTASRAFDPAELDSPAPEPRQVFAIGLNYAEHASETGNEAPPEPAVFTKFQSSLSGPYTQVALPLGNVDWEVELVVVIGRGGRDIPEDQAWSHVAGVSVGQDLSERVLQRVGSRPQFSLGKSFAGFSPVGPFLVTVDELDDPDDLALDCSVNGERVQKSRTRHLIFPVPVLIAKLSAVTELTPGDIIFTGTPSGVGLGRKPPRFLQPGDELVSRVEGVGEIRQAFVAVGRPSAPARTT